MSSSTNNNELVVMSSSTKRYSLSLSVSPESIKKRRGDDGPEPGWEFGRFGLVMLSIPGLSSISVSLTREDLEGLADMCERMLSTAEDIECDHVRITCNECKGTGETYRNFPDPQTIEPCDTCDGLGSSTQQELDDRDAAMEAAGEDRYLARLEALNAQYDY